MGSNHLRLLQFDSPGKEPERRVVLVPAIAREGAVPEEIDRQLGRIAARARQSPEALAALYRAYHPRLDHWVVRAARSCSRPGADPAIEPADVEQQAYVVFVELVLDWSGEGSLSAYLIRYFPWRLSDAVRRMTDRRERIASADIATLLSDGSHAADEAASLLEALAADLPGRQGRAVLLRFRDGLTWTQVAARLEVDVRTVHRDWRQVRDGLRAAIESLR